VRHLGLCRYPIPTRQFNLISSSAAVVKKHSIFIAMRSVRKFKCSRVSRRARPHGLPDCFDDKIMHATVRIGKTTLMASDGQCEGNQDFEGFALSITVPNETEAERVFAALGEGGL